MVYNAETGRKGVAHPTTNDNGHGKAIEDFANVVLHGATSKATAADSLGELRTALAMYAYHHMDTIIPACLTELYNRTYRYKSAATKKWEKVWADDLENVNLEAVAASVARL